MDTSDNASATKRSASFYSAILRIRSLILSHFDTSFSRHLDLLRLFLYFSEMEKRRAILLDALVAKANVIAELALSKLDGVPKSIFGSHVIAESTGDSDSLTESDETSEHQENDLAALKVDSDDSKKLAPFDHEEEKAKSAMTTNERKLEEPDKDDSEETDTEKTNLKEIDEILAEILKWADSSDPKVSDRLESDDQFIG